MSESLAPHMPYAASGPLIALLTDFGTRDGYPAVMKGVMLRIAPDARFVDISHDIPPQDVATGAWVLHTAVDYFPANTIFLCVVDPGVGSSRRAVALRIGEQTFVGPDNGLFSYVIAREAQTPPSQMWSVALDDASYHLPRASATFHGRDIFAPCAAHLARGVSITSLGTPIDPTTLASLALARPEWQGTTLVGHILHIDHFGNLISDLDDAMTDTVLAAPEASLRLGAHTITARAHTFADGPVEGPFVLRDSSGHLAIACRNGSAAHTLAVRRGDDLLVLGLKPPTTA